MSNVLGLLGFVVFIVLVIAFAAAITWLVVRLSPLPEQRRQPSSPS